MGAKNKKIAIIGSGSSSVAALSESIKFPDIEIEILDYDMPHEKELSYFLKEKKSFSKNVILKKVEEIENKINGVDADKKLYGSTYVYKVPNGHDIKKIRSKFFYSFAKGGLGNVWGANIAIFDNNDLNDWPINYNSLHKYYINILKFVGTNQPYIIKNKRILFDDSEIKLSKQAVYLYENLSESICDLKIKKSHIAVGKINSYNNYECSNCSLCMIGCPSNTIFNPRIYLNKVLKQEKKIKYKSGFLVEKISEDKNKIYIHGVYQGEKTKQAYDFVFLGAGPISTTNIILKSYGIKRKRIFFKDSQKYVFPIIINKSQKNIVNENSIKLTQLTIHNSKKIHKNKIHTQIYPYNDLIFSIFDKNKLLKKFLNLIKPLFNYFFNKLMIGMIYLDSKDSGKIKYEFNIKNKNLGYTVGIQNKNSQKIVSKYLQYLNNNKSLLNFFIPRFLLIKQLPGNSQHFGCSLPMSASADNNYQTDKYGKLNKFKNLRIIDASIFPNIPAPPFTLTIMANAARITHQSLRIFLKRKTK